MSTPNNRRRAPSRKRSELDRHSAPGSQTEDGSQSRTGSSGSGSGHRVKHSNNSTQESLKRQKAIKSIEEEPWFHGFTPMWVAESKLVSPGDWFMRTTESRRKTEIVISVRAERVINYSLCYSRTLNKWYLTVLQKKHPVYFDSIPELVDHYRTHRLPSVRTKLVTSMTRDPWNVAREKVVYNSKTDILGSGNFGKVYRAKFEVGADMKEEVAVKICHETPGRKDTFESRAKKDLYKEGMILSGFHHANVIKFYGMVLTKPPYMIIIEFCPGGSLVSHLQKQGSAISMGERILYCYEAAKGMNYLHRNNYTHRDLAARNCLVNRAGVCKIADFGLSQPKDCSLDSSELKQMHIPLRWMAPETLCHHPKFSFASDVWAFGVLVFEVFNNGTKPWPDEENRKIAGMIRKAQMMEMPRGTPPELRKVMKRLWSLDPLDRPSFKELLPVIFEWHSKTHQPPPPEKCTLNKLEGVKRCAFDKELETFDSGENSNRPQHAATTIEQTESGFLANEDQPVITAQDRSPHLHSKEMPELIKEGKGSKE